MIRVSYCTAIRVSYCTASKTVRRRLKECSGRANGVSGPIARSGYIALVSSLWPRTPHSGTGWPDRQVAEGPDRSPMLLHWRASLLTRRGPLCWQAGAQLAQLAQLATVLERWRRPRLQMVAQVAEVAEVRVLKGRTRAERGCSRNDPVQS